MVATAQETVPDSMDVFYKHLQINETVITGLAGDAKMKEMPAPVSVIRPADLAGILIFHPEPVRAPGEFGGSLFNNAFLALNLDWNMAQNHFYAAGGTETATPAYLLLGASAGTDVVIKGKTRLSLYIIGSNLTDQAYMPHLSRLKYIGIANMGRNVAIKMIVPFASCR